MSAPKLSAYINLPTLAGLEIGSRVSGHWAQADREDGIVTEIKGERAKLTFTLKSGNQSWQWVRSLAPVAADAGIRSAKSQASRTLRSAVTRVERSRKYLQQVRSEAPSPHTGRSEGEHYIHIEANGTTRFPSLWAELQRTGAYRLKGAFAYFVPTEATTAAAHGDYILELEAGHEEAREALAEAFAECNALGITSKQQDAAVAKGKEDAARWD